MATELRDALVGLCGKAAEKKKISLFYEFRVNRAKILHGSM